jgi:hypothetical protein
MIAFIILIILFLVLGLIPVEDEEDVERAISQSNVRVLPPNYPAPSRSKQ